MIFIHFFKFKINFSFVFLRYDKFDWLIEKTEKIISNSNTSKTFQNKKKLKYFKVRIYLFNYLI